MVTIICLLAIAMAAQIANAVDVPVWSGVAPEGRIEKVFSHGDAEEWSRVRVDDGEWVGNLFEQGKPELPRRFERIAVPTGMKLVGVKANVEWETVAEGVKIWPVQEMTRGGETAQFTQPDAATYGAETYPANAVEVSAEMDGINGKVASIAIMGYRWHPRSGVLERAAKIEVTAEMSGVKALRIGAKAAALMAESAKPGYLLISPPDFVEDWNWYVKERAKEHPDVAFEVKNTAEIYAEYPFGDKLEYRNAAESVHAYVRKAVSNGVQYVVLGGAWFDAQNRYSRTTYFSTGEEMTLSNCVPGVYGYPRENWRQIPSDMFYACINLKNNQRYPWDANEDGVYIDQNDCRNNDLYPDICVSRITLNPWSGTNAKYNRHTLVTNYVDKLRRGEAKTFVGHYRYGVSADSTGSRRKRANMDRMYYKELEFYDGMYNMFDPRHSDSIEDNEKATRERFHGQFSKWRPVKDVKGMMSFTWTQGFSTLGQAIDDYYDTDKDYGFVYSHGWAQGATHFQANKFASGKGLTLLNGSNGPCDTGYPDYYVTYNGKPTLAYNLGDSGVSSPIGGALCSINNTRWGWAGGSNGYDESMSYLMLNRSMIGFNQLRMDVGHSWLKGVQDYASCGAPQYGSTSTWTLTEQICYGDPLVRLPELPNIWWTGADEGGEWEAESWTNSVDDAKGFETANNVYFDAHGNQTMTITGEVAVMRLSIPMHEAGTFAINGSGKLRVMSAIDVAGENANLALNIAGGVGHSGIRFLNEAGDLTFTGTNRFYVAGITNAACVHLNGGGVTLDVDEFPKGDFPLAFNGPEDRNLPVANELRSLSIGGLKRFGPLAITNSYVKLATREAFGNGAAQTNTLCNSKLEIAANAGYQLAGYPEGLNAYFKVGGTNELIGSQGGLWTVSYITTFDLEEDSRISLGAETANGGGKIVILGTGEAEVLTASSLAGEVTVKGGVKLVLDELPLKLVTSLTIENGAEVILPDSESGYWQVVPVSSRFNCGNEVVFRSAADRDGSLVGTPSLTGSFFREGALYRWTAAEGNWDKYFANRHPKVLFGEVDGNMATVHVGLAVSPEFTYFANANTEYVFDAADEDAEVIFPGILFCGKTTFRLPVSASEYVEISGGEVLMERVTSPYVHVTSGAKLALAGSHWTEFRLDDGAILKAVPGEWLNWNGDTKFTIDETSTILIDVSDISLSDEPVKLIGGAGHVWTEAELKRFKTTQADAELRIRDGALCVVKGDDMAGPYALEVTGAANWNTDEWLANGVRFAKTWGASSLDWTEDVVITATNGESSIVADCDVHASTLTLRAGTNRFAFAGGDCEFGIGTIDLTECEAGVTMNIDTGTSAIVAPTNENAITELKRGGTGTITLKGSTLVMDESGTYTIAAGAQGELRVVATQGQTKFRIAKTTSGYELGGVEIRICDSNMNEVTGFAISHSDNALWATPPAFTAEVPSGTNEFRQLEWKDVFGNTVSNIQWDTAVGFKLIGTDDSGVVIARKGFESVWSRLSVSNDVTLLGGETFEPSVMPGGEGTITLTGGFKVLANLKAHSLLLNASKLNLGEGVIMEISHGGENLDASGQNWSGIGGVGTIRFTDSRNSWIAIPGRMFANTLSVETASDIVLTQNISSSNPFGVRNLSGSGSFRSDWGSGSNWREVKTVQTGVSDFGGILSEKSGSRDSCLTVSSDGDTATIEKALILSGDAVATHTLNIEENGCVILKGTWNGRINLSGILVITNETVRPSNLNDVTGHGRVVVMAEEDWPKVMEAAEYVPPVYPDDPDEPDEPEEETSESAKILWTKVGDGTFNWKELEWFDTNGVRVVGIDWAAITNVTLTATSECAKVVFDAVAFAGDATLSGGVRVEAHSIPGFRIAAGSKAKVDVRLATQPTASACLLQAADGFAESDVTNVVVMVHDRYGREVEKAHSIIFADGAYRMLIQAIDSPYWNISFECDPKSTITTAPGLAGGNYGSEYYTRSRSGWAYRPFDRPYITGNLPGSEAVTIHTVARMPGDSKRIMAAYGSSGDSCAVWLATGSSSNEVAIYNGNGNVVVKAAVPKACEQFHAYAVTIDTSVSNLIFYVDGAQMGTATYTGIPKSGMQFFQLLYGYTTGGLGSPSTSTPAAIDDFRYYTECLTPESIRGLAEQFAPWPESVEAEVDCEDIGWDDLYWSGDAEGGELRIVGAGGSLVITDELVVTQALATAGETIPLKMSGDGMLSVSAGLTAGATIEIDASGLDGTNLAANAVAGVPYVRWLVRGKCTGSVKVTNLPPVPDRYSVAAEQYDEYGVRLVFTAPKIAVAPSVGISIGNDNLGTTGTLGLHPTPATNWYAYSSWSDAETTLGDIGIAGKADGSIDPGTPFTSSDGAPVFMWHTSFDGNGSDYDGNEVKLYFSGLGERFGEYRVIVYFATDTGDATFAPVVIGDRTYGGLRSGSSAVSGATVADTTVVSWGRRAAVPSEGLNAVVSDVLTNGTLEISAVRQYAKYKARAQIAAVQFVKVGWIAQSDAVDYEAVVTADTDWNNGNGSGLEANCTWVNDPVSTILLKPNADATTRVRLDTVITAEVVAVAGNAGEKLTLDFAGVAHVLEGLDLSGSKCETALTNLPAGLSMTVGEGIHVRFEDEQTAQRIVSRNSIVSYRKATFASTPSALNWILRLEEEGDAVTLSNSGHCMPIDVCNGTLTFATDGTKEYWYGGNASSDTNSVITVNGGRVDCKITGEGVSASSGTRGFIIGATRQGVTRMPALVVNGGEFDCSRGLLAPWENARVFVNGGVLKTMGIRKRGNNGGLMTVTGGRVEVGKLGLGADSGDSAFPLTLGGGELRAVASATVSLKPNVSGRAVASAADDAVLTFANGVAGEGTLVCSGDVTIKGGTAATLKMEGRFTRWLTTAETNSEEEVVLFRLGEGFAEGDFTLLGPDGNAPTGGTLEYADGAAVWMPDASFADGHTEENGTVVKIPKKWLRDRSYSVEDLAANPAALGANGISIAASYRLGLEPTNAVDDTRCAIEIDEDGKMKVHLPNIKAANQPDPTGIRYILQHKTLLEDDWETYSEGSDVSTTINGNSGHSSGFFRYLIRFE